MPVRRDPPPTHMLQAFRSVAEAMSFSTAASRLGVSQSAISQRIAALESRVGARLFRRGAKGIVLTPEGEIYLQAVKPALDGLARAEQEVQDRRAIVRVSVLPSYARCRLLPRLPSLMSNFPDLSIALHVSDDRVLVDEGEYDLAIRLCSDAHSAGTPLTSDEDVRVAIAAPGICAASAGDEPFVSMALLHDDCARLRVSHEDGWALWYREAGYHRCPSRPAVVFNDAGLAVEAAAAGAGAALVRRSLVADRLRDRQLVVFGPVLPALGRTPLVQRQPVRRTASARRVAQWLTETAFAAETVSDNTVNGAKS
jgi:LysR family transcriptional regulator, glycine cleavage system transcriptional activator